jgi:hypothetical protein
MSRKGAVHTLDAFFSAVIIMTTLLYTTYVPRERDFRTSNEIKAQGIEALVLLDSNGTLGRLVDTQSWDELEIFLRVTLHNRIFFNLTIFNEEGNTINDRTISNGGFISHTIESIDYLIAVESSTFSMYRIRLQLGVR